MQKNVFWALIFLVVFFYLSQPSETETQTPTQKEGGYTEEELSQLVDASVSFTGNNKHVAATALTSESVRVIKLDGATRKDLGFRSLNSGTIGVVPENKYVFYFFMNGTAPSSTYYVDVQDYTAKVQDSADDATGEGCTIDTSPIVYIKQPNGSVNSASNPMAIGAGASVDLEVTVRAHQDECFGMPDSPKPNIICFDYNTAAFTSIQSTRNALSAPYSIGGLGLGAISCYEFDKVEDGSSDTFTVTLLANGEPTTAHNVSIFMDDAAFDLNGDTIQEIYGFVDEANNQLGYTVTTTPIEKIYVS